MITPIFNKDIVKVLSLFVVSPGSNFTRNEFKDKTKLNNVNLDNALVALLNTKIIKKEKRLFSLNINSKKIIELLSQDYKHLKEIPLDVYFIIADLLDIISFSKNIEAYLFGSYSKLIYKKESDVDIAIITKNNQDNLEKAALKLSSKYSKKIQLHFFAKKDFEKNKNDPLIKDIIKNGVKLIWLVKKISRKRK